MGSQGQSVQQQLLLIAAAAEALGLGADAGQCYRAGSQGTKQHEHRVRLGAPQRRTVRSTIVVAHGWHAGGAIIKTRLALLRGRARTAAPSGVTPGLPTLESAGARPGSGKEQHFQVHETPPLGFQKSEVWHKMFNIFN